MYKYLIIFFIVIKSFKKINELIQLARSACKARYSLLFCHRPHRQRSPVTEVSGKHTQKLASVHPLIILTAISC